MESYSVVCLNSLVKVLNIARIVNAIKVKSPLSLKKAALSRCSWLTDDRPTIWRNKLYSYRCFKKSWHGAQISVRSLATTERMSDRTCWRSFDVGMAQHGLTNTIFEKLRPAGDYRLIDTRLQSSLYFHHKSSQGRAGLRWLFGVIRIVVIRYRGVIAATADP